MQLVNGLYEWWFSHSDRIIAVASTLNVHLLNNSHLSLSAEGCFWRAERGKRWAVNICEPCLVSLKKKRSQNTTQADMFGYHTTAVSTSHVKLVNRHVPAHTLLMAYCKRCKRHVDYQIVNIEKFEN